MTARARTADEAGLTTAEVMERTQTGFVSLSQARRVAHQRHQMGPDERARLARAPLPQVRTIGSTVTWSGAGAFQAARKPDLSYIEGDTRSYR